MAASRDNQKSSTSSEVSSDSSVVSEDSESAASDAETTSAKDDRSGAPRNGSRAFNGAVQLRNVENHLLSSAPNDKGFIDGTRSATLARRNDRDAGGSDKPRQEKDIERSSLYSQTELDLQRSINSRIARLQPQIVELRNSEVSVPLQKGANGARHGTERRHRNGARKKDSSSLAGVSEPRQKQNIVKREGGRETGTSLNEKKQLADKVEEERSIRGRIHSEPENKSGRERTLLLSKERAECSRIKEARDENSKSGEAAYLLAKELARKRAEAKLKAEGQSCVQSFVGDAGEKDEQKKALMASINHRHTVSKESSSKTHRAGSAATEWKDSRIRKQTPTQDIKSHLAPSKAFGDADKVPLRKRSRSPPPSFAPNQSAVHWRKSPERGQNERRLEADREPRSRSWSGQPADRDEFNQKIGQGSQPKDGKPSGRKAGGERDLSSGLVWGAKTDPELWTRSVERTGSRSDAQKAGRAETKAFGEGRAFDGKGGKGAVVDPRKSTGSRFVVFAIDGTLREQASCLWILASFSWILVSSRIHL